MIEGKDYKIIREPRYSKLIVFEGATEIDDNQFEFYSFNEIFLPNTLKRIGKNAFNSNNALKSIVIPDSVEYIGAYAFYGCTHLEYVVLPKGITSINSDTFEFTNLKTVQIPNGVKVIGDNAFNIISCENNITIDLPPSIEMLGSLAFKKTEWLVNLNSNIKYIGYKSISDKDYDNFIETANQKSRNFIQPEKGIYINLDTKNNALVDDKLIIANKSTARTYNLSRDGVLTINDDVVAVGDFQGLNIKRVILPDSVRYILPKAFSKNSIESINFPNGLLYIGNSAFENANFNEKKLTFGNKLMLIENDAFPSYAILDISENCSCAHENVSIRKSKKYIDPFEPISKVQEKQNGQEDNVLSIENILNKDESILKYYGYQRNKIEENKDSIRGVDINTANEKGKILFDLVKNNRIDDEAVSLFISYIVEGASIYYYDNELDVSLFELLVRKNYAMLFCTLFNYGYSIDETDNEFIKIFFLSAAMENTNILELLLILGVNPNITDNSRDIALNKAIKAKNIKGIKLLLERGSAIGITNKDGNNAIDLARETNDMNIISLIEKVNIDINGCVKEEKIEEKSEDIVAEAQADLLILNRLLKGGSN